MKARNKELADFKKKMREAFSKYKRSERCGCCRGSNYEENAAVIGELLGFKKYKDGGYDFYSNGKTTEK